ncbi:MAG TPA: EamA family transporter [Polyangiaceae bacterium]|nr:EamA family transporter [Polyangiaceae bacterium]
MRDELDGGNTAQHECLGGGIPRAECLGGGIPRSQASPTASLPGAPVALGPRAAPRLAELLAFAAVYLIWGSTYLGIRVAVQSLPPFLLAGARSCSAGAALLLFARLRGARAPSALEWRRAALAGLLMLSLGNGLVTWAETYVPSNLAALSIAAVPSYVALLDWLRPGGARPTRRALIGVLIGLLGMLLLLRPDPGALRTSSWLPQLSLVVAGAAWAAGSLYARYQKLYPNAAVAGAQEMLAGGGALLLVSLLRGEWHGFTPGAVTLRSWLAFVYLTVFGSMLAFSAFSWLVGNATPSRVSTTAYVNPAVAVVLGWLVLGEPLQPMTLAGGALILCAVLVMTLRR